MKKILKINLRKSLRGGKCFKKLNGASEAYAVIPIVFVLGVPKEEGEK